MFHEMTLKLYFMKCSERKISVYPSLKNFIEILSLEIRILNSKGLIIATYQSTSENKPIYISEI